MENALPMPRVIDLTHPLGWLAAGWRDLWRQPSASLFYGAAVALTGVMILFISFSLPWLFVPSASGFLLVAPMLATGLYSLSRAYERGETLGLRASMVAWLPSALGFIGISLLVLIAGTIWQLFSLVMLAMLYHGPAMTPLDLIHEIIVDPEYTGLFFLYVGVGGLAAAMVFALTVISMPLLLDRGGHALDAMLVSFNVVASNPVPLALWAVLIMLFTGIGFATGMLGFVIILPWLGHASWHAYRDLVQD
ncbi:MAG: DUF2189 domain-containing protein [Proteobacteria bacterium]|nr:DUF2189 domain-containing protein [Pseudomonadota bacterium]HQR04596.1 DUF2189 domain-containing protein [Rhodocyclaceae bacterium]